MTEPISTDELRDLATIIGDIGSNAAYAALLTKAADELDALRAQRLAEADAKVSTPRGSLNSVQGINGIQR